MGKNFGDVFAALCNSSPPTILVGLYRRKKTKGDKEHSTYFVAINPVPDTILNSDDWLYLLVNHASDDLFNDNLFETPARGRMASRDTSQEEISDDEVKSMGSPRINL